MYMLWKCLCCMDQPVLGKTDYTHDPVNVWVVLLEPGYSEDQGVASE